MAGAPRLSHQRTADALRQVCFWASAFDIALLVSFFIGVITVNLKLKRFF